MRSTIKSALIVLFGAISLSVRAQSDEMKVAINELNGSYAGAYRFSISAEKQLEVAFYNSSGHFRNDVVYLDYLDTSMIVYNASEEAVSIRCADTEDKCIDKEIFKLDVVRHSSRINLKEESAAQAEKTIALLQKIISLHLEQEQEKEQEAKLGETRRKR